MRGKGSVSVVQRELTKEKALLILPQGPPAASKSEFVPTRQSTAAPRASPRQPLSPAAGRSPHLGRMWVFV